MTTNNTSNHQDAKDMSTVFSKEGILPATNTVSKCQFGWSVSLDDIGNRVIVSGRGIKSKTRSNQGRAHIFVRDGDTWTEEAILTASDDTNCPYFGEAVSMNGAGNTVIIGSPRVNSNQGRAYIFTRDGTTWVQEAILDASNDISKQMFGRSVCINNDGSRVIVGTWGANNLQGLAYIFIKEGSTWTQETILSASDGAVFCQFGKSVSIDSVGNRVVVSANRANSQRGQAYIFIRDGSTWTEEAILSASDGADEDDFGTSVSIDSTGTRVVVGAQYVNSKQGQAYIFVRDGDTWTEEAILRSSGGIDSQRFGESVFIGSTGDTVVIGSYGVHKPYIFTKDGTTWIEKTTLTLDDELTDSYGVSVSMSGDGNKIAVGTHNCSSYSGKALVFNQIGS